MKETGQVVGMTRIGLSYYPCIRTCVSQRSSSKAARQRARLTRAKAALDTLKASGQKITKRAVANALGMKQQGQINYYPEILALIKRYTNGKSAGDTGFDTNVASEAPAIQE